MKTKEKLSWLLNLKSGKNYTSQNSSLFSQIPSKLNDKSLSSFTKASQQDHSLTIDSSTKNITKPFILHDRSDLNREFQVIKESKTQKFPRSFNSFHEKHGGIQRLTPNFVKLHSKGFSGDMSDDFFKHYYRMLLVNLTYFMRKNEKYDPVRLELMESEDLKKEINYIPADIKLFFLEKTQKDVIFYEKIIELYENKAKTNIEKTIGNLTNLTSSLYFANKPIELPEKFNYLENFNEKFFKEDEFLKIFVKKVKKFGVNIVTIDDYLLLKQILLNRKAIISSISAKKASTKNNSTKNSLLPPPKIKENLDFMKRRSNFLELIKNTIKNAGFMEEESLQGQDLALCSMNISLQDPTNILNKLQKSLITNRNQRSSSNSPRIGINGLLSNRVYRSLTERLRKNFKNIAESEPELALHFQYKDKKNREKVNYFSKSTQKFLKDILSKRDSKLEKVLNKIRAKSDGNYVKKGVKTMKKLNSLAMDGDLEVIDEGLELNKVDIFVREIEKISKMTNEEILAGDIDSFIARAEQLERQIRENAADIEKNYAVSQEGKESRAVSRAGSNARGESQAGSNASSIRNKEKTMSTDRKHAKNHLKEKKDDNNDRDNLENEDREESLMSKNKNNNYNMVRSVRKNYRESVGNSMKKDSSILEFISRINRKTSLPENIHFTQYNDNNNDDHMNNDPDYIANRKTPILDHIDNDDKNKIEINKIHSNLELPLLSLKQAPRKTSSLPHISNEIIDSLENPNIIRAKSKSTYSRDNFKSFQTKSSRASDLQRIKPLAPIKKPPVPSFRNALSLLPYLKKTLKKKIYEHKIVIDKNKISSSIPQASPTIKRSPKKPKKPDYINLIVNKVDDINENTPFVMENNKSDESPKTNLTFQKSVRLLITKQNSKIYGNLKSPLTPLPRLKTPTSPMKYDLDGELLEALNELEVEKDEELLETPKIIQKKKKKKELKLNREPTMISNEDVSNKKLLSEERNLPENEFQWRKSEIQTSKIIDPEIDYNAEVKQQNRDEIEIFIKNMEENIEKNLLGELPCIDQMKLFIDQAENNLKSPQYPWKKKALIFFETLPSPKKIHKDKSFKKKDKNGNLDQNEYSSESEEEENIVNVMDSFQRTKSTFFKDEIMRKREFMKQREILKMVKTFLGRTSSYVKQRGLSEDLKAFMGENDINDENEKNEKKHNNEKNDKKNEKNDKNKNKSAHLNGIAEKEEKEMRKRKDKGISEENRKKNHEEKKYTLTVRREREFDVFFTESKKKSKERMKVKIF